jgi:hypothetical protein
MGGSQAIFQALHTGKHEISVQATDACFLRIRHDPRSDATLFLILHRDMFVKKKLRMNNLNKYPAEEKIVNPLKK